MICGAMGPMDMARVTRCRSISVSMRGTSTRGISTADTPIATTGISTYTWAALCSSGSDQMMRSSSSIW